MVIIKYKLYIRYSKIAIRINTKNRTVTTIYCHKTYVTVLSLSTSTHNG